MMDLYNRIQTYTTHNKSELSSDFFLTGDVRSILACVALYVYMCVYGPRFMRDRKEVPFLKPIMQIYNIAMIITNSYILYELCATISGCSWTCEVGDFSISPRNTRHARALWLYYISKVIEYIDTFFFIGRKKFSHVSFLHVYHHASMSVLMWTTVTFFPTGDAFVPVIYNTVIHVIMYSYYFLSALGPQFQKYLWWKRHLTKMQIIQFVLIIVYGVGALYISCNPNYWFIYLFIITYMISFVFLFLSFYFRKYIYSSQNNSNSHQSPTSASSARKDK